VRFIETMRAHPGDKTRPPEATTALRAIFMKSVVAARDLPAGSALREEDLAAKKPGSGIPARELPSLVGRRLRRFLARDTLLSKDDLE
jgi:N-acetylneuraminate synthase